MELRREKLWDSKRAVDAAGENASLCGGNSSRGLRNRTAHAQNLFFNYPEDENCWETEDEIMLGRDLLAAPVTYPGMIPER